MVSIFYFQTLYIALKYCNIPYNCYQHCLKTHWMWKKYILKGILTAVGTELSSVA